MGPVGQDVDGLCAILRAAGHEVITKGIVAAPARLDALSDSAAAVVLAVYYTLGGRLESPALRPGAWDLTADGILVELDEQLHFNRYRATTLEASSYARLPRFPLEAYRAFSVAKEQECVRLGCGQGRWMNASTEAHFGPSGPRGELSGNGSSRWKQRALYDLMKDLTQLDPDAPRLARIAIWDPLPGVPGVTVETAVHRPPDERVACALSELIGERSGQRL
jgi:hypothetical protein